MGNNPPLYNTPAQAYQKDRLTYPAMGVREILIWKAWLTAHEAEYERYDYNIRVGTGIDPGPGYADNIRRDAVLITQKRIDAVGWVGNVPTLFEIKERPGFSAIGQILSYAAHWPLSFPGTAPPKTAIVGVTFDADILVPMDVHRIQAFKVEPDFSQIAALYPLKRLA